MWGERGVRVRPVADGPDLTNAKKITANISGCCGQMDVQCCGDDIVVAENTKHRFARYDRDGKELAAGGKRGKETDPGCFGGCCNPMNVKACGADVLTAESEGIIKKFGPTGEFKGIVGSVKISGGCKNVAVGSNPDASRVYFCDQPGSRVLILAKKDDEKKGEEKKAEEEKTKWSNTLAGQFVTVHEHLDGRMSIRYGPHVIAQYAAVGLPPQAPRKRGTARPPNGRCVA